MAGVIYVWCCWSSWFGLVSLFWSRWFVFVGLVRLVWFGLLRLGWFGWFGVAVGLVYWGVFWLV